MLRWIVSILVFVVCIPNAFASRDFLISFWGGPELKSDPQVVYRDIAQCGFNYSNLPTGTDERGRPYPSPSVEQNKRILDACSKYGVKYIVPDARTTDKMPGDPGFASNLDAVIKDYGRLPGTGGYFIADEPSAVRFPQLAAVNAYLKSKDPSKLRFFNLFPNYASAKQLGTSTYEQYIEQFCSQVKPDILGYDHYAVFLKGKKGDEQAVDSYFLNMELIRAEGLKYNIPTCLSLLSTSHEDYEDPTLADLRWQVNTALAYGYKGIMYFTYQSWNPKVDTGIVNVELKRTHHFNQVKRINNELHVLGGVLAGLKSTEVYHTGKLPKGCKPQNRNSILQAQSNLPVLIGLFKDAKGSTWAFVMNRDMQSVGDIKLLLAPQYHHLIEKSKSTGIMREVNCNVDGGFDIRLQAGDGALFMLE